jgi:hypothetical protein
MRLRLNLAELPNSDSEAFVHNLLATAERFARND